MLLTLNKLVPALIIAVLIVTACGSDAPSDKDVLVSLVDEVVVPVYNAVSEDAAQLGQDVQILCDAPSSPSLQTARESWREARGSWMFSEAMWFGPVMDRRSLSLLDWSPTDTAAIDNLLADAAPVSVEDVRNVLASNQRGFGAIEHILFHSDAIVSLSNYPKRCAYLTDMVQVVQEETAAILSDWIAGSETPPYKDYFSDRADRALIPKSAIAEVVRTQVFLIRNMVDMRLVSALGLRDGPPDLSSIPGNAADNGWQDLSNELLGMQAVYEGVGQDGLGISALVAHLSEETDTRLRSQFTAAIEAIDSVDGSLRVALAENPGQVRTVYDRLADVQRTISTEVVSLLGVSVGFTDTDGDSLR